MVSELTTEMPGSPLKRPKHSFHIKSFRPKPIARKTPRVQLQDYRLVPTTDSNIRAFNEKIPKTHISALPPSVIMREQVGGSEGSCSRGVELHLTLQVLELKSRQSPAGHSAEKVTKNHPYSLLSTEQGWRMQSKYCYCR